MALELGLWLADDAAADDAGRGSRAAGTALLTLLFQVSTVEITAPCRIHSAPQTDTLCC